MQSFCVSTKPQMSSRPTLSEAELLLSRLKAQGQVGRLEKVGGIRTLSS